MTPAGYNETSPNTTDDTNDSDADPVTGNAPLTNLVSGESDQTIDAGIYRPATIGDYVWRDTDGDGIQDPTEIGINGVTVLLKDATTLAVLQLQLLQLVVQQVQDIITLQLIQEHM
jgi:serine-aspartate repeat-containing protein C/D/E